MNRPELNWDALFETLSLSPLQVSLVVTGGGTGAVARCFRRPGASHIFVEAVIPYSRTSLASYLATAPRGLNASPERACQLAATALSRAESYAEKEPPYEAAGISLVSALPTTYKRRGTDQIHVALHRQTQRLVWSLDLASGVYDRETAESIADEMLFVALSRLRCDADKAADETGGCHHLRDLHLVCQNS